MEMAYHTRQDLSSRPPPYNQQLGQTGVFVVDQQPPARGYFRFPINFPVGKVLATSIIKCVVGSLYFIFGIINIFVVPHYTAYVAFPVWCGLLIIANGIVGCCLWKRKSKCLIGAFCGLSIASLVLTVVMLTFYSLALAYFVDNKFYYYNCDYYGCNYYRRYSGSHIEAATGLSGFMLFMILVELGCSIAAVVFSCKAYSKCCTTCDVNDCCACVGCCECDTSPLDTNQMSTHPEQQIGMLSQSSHGGASLHHQQPQQQLQFGTGTNPCSALLNVIINIPGASYLIDSTRSAPDAQGAQTVSVTIHPNNEAHPSGSNTHAGAEGPSFVTTVSPPPQVLAVPVRPF